MSSETTAAASGATGVLRRDPMAMLPFCGYHMGDYFAHWIAMGAKTPVDKQPKFFNVNWFRLDDNGNFIWPGFGDNMRVLDWIIKRVEGSVDAQETAIGFVPNATDLNMKDCDIDMATLESILAVDKASWAAEAVGIQEFYGKFGDRLPAELATECEVLIANTK